jgi:hypothetical protein
MEGTAVKQVIAIKIIAACAFWTRAWSRFLPENGAMRRRRYISIRLTNVVVKRLPVKGLGLTWIRLQPLVQNSRLQAWYSVVVFAKRRPGCGRVRLSGEVPGTHRFGAIARMGIDLPARLLTACCGLFHRPETCVD